MNILREAKSSPFINITASDPERINKSESRNSVRSTSSTQGLRQIQNASIGLKDSRMHFNTGSCTSIDLSKIMDFYTDSSDPDIMKNWMTLYEAQRLASSSVDLPMMSENHYNSTKDLREGSLCKESIPQETSDGTNNSKYLNRSMDVLPVSSAAKENFRLLEKCCSVELTAAIFPTKSVLKRSKEMPNIADVDGYE